jgi:hypothetical protein
MGGPGLQLSFQSTMLPCLSVYKLLTTRMLLLFRMKTYKKYPGGWAMPNGYRENQDAGLKPGATESGQGNGSRRLRGRGGDRDQQLLRADVEISHRKLRTMRRMHGENLDGGVMFLQPLDHFGSDFWRSRVADDK